jgi:hypothetical protein
MDESGDYGPPTFMDNPKGVGAPKGWKWGYLPCGCRNDGYGYHLNDSRSPWNRRDQFGRSEQP